MCAQQNRKCIRNLLAALIGVTLSVTAFAQTFPTKPIRLIVTFAAGSTADVVARAIAQPMAQTLGQPVVVENKPGAGGGIGITAVAQSPKDGYTIGIGTSASMAINPSLAKGTPYDPIADLTPVALIALVPQYPGGRPSDEGRYPPANHCICKGGSGTRSTTLPRGGNGRPSAGRVASGRGPGSR